MGQTPSTRRHNASRKAKAKTDADKYLGMAARGWSISEIARHFGVARSTVHERIAEERDQHPAPNLEMWRETLIASANHGKRTLHRRMKEAGDETVACVLGVLRHDERIARLVGADAPIRSIQTEEELEAAMNKLRDRLPAELFEKVVAILADVSTDVSAHGEGPEDGAGSAPLPGGDRGAQGGTEGA